MNTFEDPFASLSDQCEKTLENSRILMDQVEDALQELRALRVEVQKARDEVASARFNTGLILLAVVALPIFRWVWSIF